MFNFFKKKAPVISRGTYGLMAEGFPPDDLTWDKAFELWKTRMTPMCIEALPSSCPICNAKMVEGKHDWWDIECGGQYMVLSATCPNGHGYALDVA